MFLGEGYNIGGETQVTHKGEKRVLGGKFN